MSERGYLYAFTESQVRDELEPYVFIKRLRDVKIEGDREYQDWLDLLKKAPDASVGFKTVVLSVFRICRDSADDLAMLDAQYPGFELFLLVNPTVHALMQKSGQYESIGTITTNRIKVLQQELFLYFLATPMESNLHLWPEDYWPKRTMVHPRHRLITVKND
jgi:hypothetical protein